MTTTFGKFLRILRIKNAEILKDMSAKLGLSIAYLSSIENGKREIPSDLYDKICSNYIIDIEEQYKLREAIDFSRNETIINLKNLTKEKKELSLLYARKIESLSEEEVKKLKDFFK